MNFIPQKFAKFSIFMSNMTKWKVDQKMLFPSMNASTVIFHITPERRLSLSIYLFIDVIDFRALQRNFHACVDAAQRSQEPNERNRFNEPDGSSPNTPDCRDLGYLIREIFEIANKQIFWNILKNESEFVFSWFEAKLFLKIWKGKWQILFKVFLWLCQDYQEMIRTL